MPGAQGRHQGPLEFVEPTSAALLATAVAVAAIPSARAGRPTAPRQRILLANGMQVVVIPDTRAPVVTQSCGIAWAGPTMSLGQSGIAHFLEH